MLRVLFFIPVCVTLVASTFRPVVKVKHGGVSGLWKESQRGRKYASFQGVPYARPPVGEFRFREPQELDTWPGTWDASRPLSRCLQYDPDAGIIGDENCLFVNVYTPTLDPGADLPVLVFIHGGAFMYGTGSLYDPAYLMDRDIVVVTLNYRVGPLGFLSTGDDVIQGNMGLKDQSFALHWVQENIRVFGGNPDNVTLSGLSAGGASVHYHYLSPLSKGTFARGFAMSGSDFCPWSFSVKPVQKAKTLAAIVGCPPTNSQDLADCLKTRPGEVIVRAQLQMFDWKIHLFTPFTPTVEAPGSKDPFLTENPFLASLDGQMHNVPLITSVTSEEGLYPAAAYQRDPSILKELEERWTDLASNIFEFSETFPLAQRKEVAMKIKERYLGGPVGQDTFDGLVQALSDRLFVVDVGKLAQLHALQQPVYVYRYSFRGDKSLSNSIALNDVNYGVSHADDLYHIMKYADAISTSAADMQVTEYLLDLVYSYASEGVPKIGNVTWTPVVSGSSTIDFLEISGPDQLEMRGSSDFGNRSFWDSLGFLENENYHKHFRDEL